MLSFGIHDNVPTAVTQIVIAHGPLVYSSKLTKLSLIRGIQSAQLNILRNDTCRLPRLG